MINKDQQIAKIYPQKRDFNLDFLKAISILLVLSWHFQPIQLSSLKNPPSLWHTSILFLVNTFNSQCTLVSVPIFIIVSLYLYFVKCQGTSIYTKKRIIRLLEIFSFWAFIHTLVYVGMFFYAKIKGLNIKFLPIEPIKFIVGGGPAVPYLGATGFYFLFILIIVTLLATIYRTDLKLGNRLRKNNLINIVIIVIFMSYFEITNLSGIPIPYWRVDNFLIYVPVVALIVNNIPRFYRFHNFYFIGFILFSFQDFILTNQGKSLGVYGRNSILLGAIFLFSFVQSKSLQQNKYLSYLSKYSLGIFTIHQYLRLGLENWLPKVLPLTSQVITIIDSQLKVFPLIISFLAFMLTLIVIYCLSFTPAKKFIS